MRFWNRQPRPNRAPTAPRARSENRAHRAPPPTGAAGATGARSVDQNHPTAPRSCTHNQTSLWATWLPVIALGQPTLHVGAGSPHLGQPNRLALAADGTLTIRCGCGHEVQLPPAKTGQPS